MEEAAASLGAGALTIFRRDRPPDTCCRRSSPASRSRSRAAVGEFGSVVLISGNLPFKTEVASVYIFGQIESDDRRAARPRSRSLLLVDLASASCSPIGARSRALRGERTAMSAKRWPHRASVGARLPGALLLVARSALVFYRDVRARLRRRVWDAVTTPDGAARVLADAADRG